ncbi:MAG: accB [Caulobacteraceae bacterium]|nr:accB [Caulobacteraceae bacterium]
MTESGPEGESPDEEAFDVRLVRDLADVLNETGLTEIEVERGDLRIRVAKTLVAAPVPAAIPASLATPAPVQREPAAAAAPAKPAGEAVKSPMVGTVYLQSQPGAPPFVRVGDRVSQGQTLLLVEAMKTMNPIGAPRAGVVAELLVADGQPVEYGEPLVVLGPVGG